MISTSTGILPELFVRIFQFCGKSDFATLSQDEEFAGYALSAAHGILTDKAASIAKVCDTVQAMNTQLAHSQTDYRLLTAEPAPQNFRWCFEASLLTPRKAENCPTIANFHLQYALMDIQETQLRFMTALAIRSLPSNAFLSMRETTLSNPVATDLCTFALKYQFRDLTITSGSINDHAVCSENACREPSCAVIRCTTFTPSSMKPVAMDNDMVLPLHRLETVVEGDIFTFQSKSRASYQFRARQLPWAQEFREAFPIAMVPFEQALTSAIASADVSTLT